MKKLKLKVSFYLFFCFLSILTAPLQAAPPAYSVERVHDNTKLLPGLKVLHEMHFAIPDDFIGELHSEKGDLHEGIYWGQKGVIKNFKDEKAVECCIIKARMSTSVKQKGKTNEFEMDPQMAHEWRKLGGRELRIRKLNWGPFPVLCAECVSLGGTHYYMAWVGLNEPDGKTLMFTLLAPDRKNIPTSLELAIWYHFLHNSKAPS